MVRNAPFGASSPFLNQTTCELFFDFKFKYPFIIKSEITLLHLEPQFYLTVNVNLNLLNIDLILTLSLCLFKRPEN